MAIQVVPEKSMICYRVVESNLFQYARKVRDDGFLNDVRITAGEESIHASKLVLACNSKYFERMFKSSMKEKHSHSVEIEGAQGAAVKAIVDYFYSESIEINKKTVMDLLAASDYLQVDDVTQFCFNFLQSNISPENSIPILHAAILYRNHALADLIYQYVSNHLEEVIQTGSFKSLPKSAFVDCLSRINLTEANATSSYRALISWINHNKETREREFGEIFPEVIDLTKLPIDFFEDVLLDEPLVIENATCHQLVLRTFAKLLKSTRADLVQQRLSKVISLGGYKTRQKVQDVISLHGQTFLTYPDLPAGVDSHCSLKLNGQLLCVGGDKSLTGTWISTDEVFQLKQIQDQTPKWMQVASMIEKRCQMGACVHQNYVVVVAGYNGESITDSVEFYQSKADSWKEASPVKQPRRGHAVVSCENYLYALGGYDGVNCLSSAERLRDINGEWKNVKAMNEPRYQFAAVTCNDIIYTIGGRSNYQDLASALKTVERYDDGANAWTYVTSMNIERRGHSACVLNGTIIVVGGLNKNGEVVKEIECYDPSYSTWSIVGRTNGELWLHSTVAM